MNVSVSESVMDLIETLEGETPFSAEERPSTDEIRRIEVINGPEDISETYVEIFMEIHKNGDAAEPLTIEFHPHRSEQGWKLRGHDVVRVLQKGRLDENEKEQYRVFGAVVGRLAYHEP